MKKSNFLFLAALSASVAFTSCEHNNEPTPDPEGTTYPRVQLIEHFTGAACGHCPYGMDFIYEEYEQNADNYVWVSNHYGYGTDEYTISGSSKIGKKLGVSGAPNISVNRYKYVNSSEGVSGRSYHPYYISDVMSKQETTATSQVVLDRTYDAASRNLHVKATIKTSDAALSGVYLTLGVTESGMIGTQQDYMGSWEGWQEYVHTHAIRVYASNALGDTVQFTNRIATAEYDIQIEEGWAAENCEIVAWITEAGTYYPVLNAAKLPVVEGTDGGESIKHHGVTMVAVPDSYPEEGAPVSQIRFTSALYVLATQNDVTYANIILQSDTVVGQNNYGYLYPYVVLLAVLPNNATELVNGTYTVSNSLEVGTIVAGVRNDETIELEGSLIETIFSYQGSYYLGQQWMVDAGQVSITDSAIALNVTTKNGSTYQGIFAGKATLYNGASAPKNAPAPLLIKAEGSPKNKLLFF